MTASDRRAGGVCPGNRLRAAGTIAILAALAACSQPARQQDALQETARYVAHAHRNYTPPGPSEDPWGPYIREAGARFDIPEIWIRSLMRVESGGSEYRNGDLITSGAGAMGLMQVMPATYDGLRDRYNLGDDPFDPHDNIMAGVAYMREMYELYGTPGFLAAYNAGPSRLDDYLANVRPLPDETRHYVARIGPNIAGVYPQHPSQATQFAMMQMPIDIPPGPRYPRRPAPAPVALADNRGRGGWTRGEVQVAALPAPPPPAPPPPQVVAFDAPRPSPQRGLHLIPRAMADTLPLRATGPLTGDWAIQVGAFGNAEQARAAAEAARGHVHDMLAQARPMVGTVRQAHATLYRARLTGLSREAAVQACEKLAHRGACMVVSPDAQS